MTETGFELEELTGERKPLPPCGKYGYAGFLDTVPMVFGTAVMAAAGLLGRISGTGEWGTMAVYAFLASLVAAGCADQALDLHVSDLLQERGRGRILPAFGKSCVFLLAGGGIVYGIFLVRAGAGRGEGIFSWIFFVLLTLVWTAMVCLAVLEGPVTAARACVFSLLPFFSWRCSWPFRGRTA